MLQVKIITVAGPPSAGKTAVIIHVARLYLASGVRVAAVKFDALSTRDDEAYAQKLGISAIAGISDYVCPDHYYVSNLEEVLQWGANQMADVLFIETAGLCFRCAPHIQGVPALTIIDNLSGLDTPGKMGPALFLADFVAITKGDLVSQAEKEVFSHRIKLVNPQAKVLHVNGLTGNGSLPLKRLLDDSDEVDQLTERSLRYSMPASICSYCTGETRVGLQYQSGNVVKINAN